MKAFLLAAGLGTRLKPVTDTIPKCLVPIAGVPLLEYWMILFRKYGVDEVLINTHYLNRQVEEYVKKIKYPKITLSFEESLLGSGGTVLKNRDFVKNEESFFICYADNLTNADLGYLREQYDEKGKMLTMALFRADNPKSCGIAELDANGTIISFEEKPEVPKSNLANAGIYVTSPKIMNNIPEGFSDFGKDVIPKLVGRMSGIEIADYLLDIGTPENYAKAQREVNDGLFRKD